MHKVRLYCCPDCHNRDLEFEYEETPSFIPGMMWQVCPTHGRVSEYKWHPSHQYDIPFDPRIGKDISWAAFRAFLHNRKFL